MKIKNNILKIQDQIRNRQTAINSTKNIQLIAVSKYQSTEQIIEAIQAGITHFGENKIQEAYEKWPQIKKDYPEITLHLIGKLQTNKVRQALEIFDVIQTLDRPKLLYSLIKYRNLLIDKKFFIQVNTSNEPQKSGVSPLEFDALFHLCNESNIIIEGLMCLPQQDGNPETEFNLLANLAAAKKIPNLSMGMSDNFLTAINCGANYVRIGSAIFK